MNHPDAVKVLVVEDDSEDYRLIARQLHAQGRGFVLDWAENLTAACGKLDRISFDVILTDLSLPDSTGLETVSSLRERAKHQPIIVLTSIDDECIEQDILEAGAQDYLVKGELNGRATTRIILHAIQRERMQNELRVVLSEREQDQFLLQQQAVLLKRKNRRLRRLYKTAQEFVDNVSHDFRTPLTVIKDYVAIICEGMVGDISNDQRMMLDKVAVRADDLNNMVDDLLDVSKLEAGLLGAWRRKVSVRTILDRAESMLRQRALVKNVDFTVDCEHDLPEVYCDADMVVRVITNLAVNAMKFSGDGGRVRLWVEADPAEQQVLVGVTDNGPGIDSESLAQLFKRFRQLNSHVKSTVKGFGLGLNIAHELCQVNLGDLSVQSRVGEGSTFSFNIPNADPHAVLPRWLKKLKSSDDTLKLIKISVADEVAPARADEFDSFLNCLLRKRDLLFRVSTSEWLLMMVVPASESSRWRRRAKKEFDRHNRNRPMGPLPNYRIVTRGKWDSIDDTDAILGDFRAILRKANQAEALA